MNPHFLIITLICMFSLHANSQSEEYKVERAMEEYFAILKYEGYTPEYDNDNDIAFKMEGKWYYIVRTDYADAFSLQRHLSHEDGCDLKTLTAINHASRSTRYAKGYLFENCETLVIKSNLYNNGVNVEEMVSQAMDAVKYYEEVFLEEYNK